jgi:hypothetical protein
MRGADVDQGGLFSYVSMENRIPPTHPLRRVRALLDEALESIGRDFDRVYAEEVAACTDSLPLFLIPMRRRIVQEIHLDLGRRTLRAHQWFNEVIGALSIYSWYRYEERHGVQRVAVPVLTGVQECMAYALAVVQEDRWKPSIAERIRMCPYRYPQLGEDQKGHFFLDYRFGVDGELEKNRQIFCCHEHANRFKQSKHRRNKARRAMHK